MVRFLPLVAFLVLLLFPRDADAYTWMIRHDYGGCGSCHADPSGGGPLTEYGRAQGDLLLRMHYGGPQSDEPSKTSGFLLGLFGEPPTWLMPSGDVRAMGLLTKPGSAAFTDDFILMQADLRAAVAVGRFRAGGSVGAVTSEGSAATVVGPVVSREHWAGVAFGDDAFLLRAGRINVPFGIRSIEHTFLVRTATRTDLNDTQQHGAALSYSGEKLRGEIMGIAGNYQIAPDAYRQRGYSGYVEYALAARYAVGVSSLVTHANKDLVFHAEDTRQAHGVFARLAPARPIVLLAEADATIHSLVESDNLYGYAGMFQADLEAIQGLHVIGTVEAMDPGGPQHSLWYGGWLGVNWFALPHLDFRTDAMMERMRLGPTSLDVIALAFQVHGYL